VILFCNVVFAFVVFVLDGFFVLVFFFSCFLSGSSLLGGSVGGFLFLLYRRYLGRRSLSSLCYSPGIRSIGKEHSRRPDSICIAISIKILPPSPTW